MEIVSWKFTLKGEVFNSAYICQRKFNWTFQSHMKLHDEKAECSADCWLGQRPGSPKKSKTDPNCSCNLFSLTIMPSEYQVETIKLIESMWAKCAETSGSSNIDLFTKQNIFLILVIEDDKVVNYIHVHRKWQKKNNLILFFISEKLPFNFFSKLKDFLKVFFIFIHQSISGIRWKVCIASI